MSAPSSSRARVQSPIREFEALALNPSLAATLADAITDGANGKKYAGPYHNPAYESIFQALASQNTIPQIVAGVYDIFRPAAKRFLEKVNKVQERHLLIKRTVFALQSKGAAHPLVQCIHEPAFQPSSLVSAHTNPSVKQAMHRHILEARKALCKTLQSQYEIEAQELYDWMRTTNLKKEAEKIIDEVRESLETAKGDLKVATGEKMETDVRVVGEEVAQPQKQSIEYMRRYLYMAAVRVSEFATRKEWERKIVMDKKQVIKDQADGKKVTGATPSDLTKEIQAAVRSILKQERDVRKGVPKRKRSNTTNASKRSSMAPPPPKKQKVEKKKPSKKVGTGKGKAKAK